MSWLLEGFETITIFASFLAFAVSVYCLRNFRSFVGGSRKSLRDFSKSHNWRSVKDSTQSWSCNVCESLLISNGFYCDCCGIGADPACLKKADSDLLCKEVSSTDTQPMVHHWVKGNLKDGSECIVCNEECGIEAPSDVRCVWCQRTVHTNCLTGEELLNGDCDLGDWARFILSPKHVRLDLRGTIKEIVPSTKELWTPLFVIGNKKSGNEKGSEIMSGFRHFLNRVQVLELSSPLQELLSIAPKTSCILVAGGDGTIASLFTSLQKLEINDIGVSILPLGTGNDLSRALGWGSAEPDPFSPIDTFRSLEKALPAYLDRWRVLIRGSGLRRRGWKDNQMMYNYLSIGVDAQVTLDFHRTRQSPFYLFSNRIFNKMLYLGFGTQQVVERGCRKLEERVELWLDGHQVELPAIEAIVVLNIPYWGAGVRLWPEEGQSMCDGLLEVLGIYSSFHIAQLQVGLSEPHVFGQASNVVIQLKSNTPMQIDGEPWVQSPARIEIKNEGQAKVLLRLDQSA